MRKIQAGSGRTHHGAARSVSGAGFGPGRDNRVAGGELCFVLGLALLLLASCVPYRCRSLQYRWLSRACALRQWQSGLRFAGANERAIATFGKPGGRMNLRSNGRSKRMRS